MRRLLLIICLFFPTAALAQEGNEPLPRAPSPLARDWLEKQETEAAEARLERIKEEISSLGGHAWAGNYYCGDGLASNNSIWLAPDSGAYLYGRGCLGPYMLNHGDIVRVTDDRIEIRWVIPPDVLSSPTLVRVRWGTRRYLVFGNDVARFLDSAAEGQELVNPMTGYLHELDRRREVWDAPRIPSDFLEEHDAPVITGSVIETDLDAPVFNMFRAESLFSRVWLNLGSDDGIKEGDNLYPAGTREFAAGVFNVTEVEPKRCQAFFRKSGPRRKPPVPPAIGFRVTSFPPGGLVARRKPLEVTGPEDERDPQVQQGEGKQMDTPTPREGANGSTRRDVN